MRTAGTVRERTGAPRERSRSLAPASSGKRAPTSSGVASLGKAAAPCTASSSTSSKVRSTCCCSLSGATSSTSTTSPSRASPTSTWRPSATLEHVDLDAAADFIYTAALLIQIKTRMLMPRPETGRRRRAGRPARELVDRLLEYVRFKEASRRARRPLRGAPAAVPARRRARRARAAGAADRGDDTGRRCSTWLRRWARALERAATPRRRSTPSSARRSPSTCSGRGVLSASRRAAVPFRRSWRGAAARS